MTSQGHAGLAVVTGGTAGLGRAVSFALARKGFEVLALGLPPATELLTLVLAEQLACTVVEVDVRDEKVVSEVIGQAVEKHGPVRALVNNAGVHRNGTVPDTDPALWREVMDINLGGAFTVSRAVLPSMISGGGGAIVNISSVSARGNSALAAYCASKAGIVGLSLAMARDHARDRVRVNVVLPGVIDTAMLASKLDRATPEDQQRIRQAAAESNVQGRVPTPEDYVGAVMFLLSDDSLFVSGALLDVGTLPGPS